MQDYMENDAAVLRNLQDAGCDAATIERFFALRNAGNQRELSKLLSLHRASLLDQVHVGQRRIDCLDYLVYAIQHKQS